MLHLRDSGGEGWEDHCDRWDVSIWILSLGKLVGMPAATKLSLSQTWKDDCHCCPAGHSSSMAFCRPGEQPLLLQVSPPGTIGLPVLKPEERPCLR